MEVMDGAPIQPIIANLEYSEEFCKYTLFRIVKGLADLHG